MSSLVVVVVGVAALRRLAVGAGRLPLPLSPSRCCLCVPPVPVVSVAALGACVPLRVCPSRCSFSSRSFRSKGAAPRRRFVFIL